MQEFDRELIEELFETMKDYCLDWLLFIYMLGCLRTYLHWL